MPARPHVLDSNWNLEAALQIIAASCVLFLAAPRGAIAQSGGSVDGSILDPTGAAIAGASVTIENRITGYQQSAATDATGTFRFRNVPPNSYHLAASAPGFNPSEQEISVRSAVPVTLKLSLSVAGGQTTVTVEAEGSALENVPYAHNDIDQSSFSKLPALSPGSALSDAIILGSPGVVSDSNGFFHPLGDHAQVTFSVDNQPISDQQSKQFSTQLPLNAIQSMELITGAPGAEYGDKTSLVVNAVTRSGLGQPPHGSFTAQYGSFGTAGEQASLGLGTAKFGNFLVFNAQRSGRFLDSPEFHPMHDIGNNGTFFDRVDYQPSGRDALHLNLFAARNWFQIPDTYDQPQQDQRQRVITMNIAPGYQHTFSPQALLTVSPFVREDQVSYFPSADPFADSPATLAQGRRLLNYGGKVDFSYVRGGHNLKIGVQLMQTRLKENFRLGITDPGFNPVCVDASGAPQGLASVTDPASCAVFGLEANPDLNPGLVPFDLTRGGSLFQFAGAANISQFAFYVQDSITWGNWTLSPGLRVDEYDGLSQASGVQPRLGVSYRLKPTSTVLRAAYSRTFETPYNENLVLSSATGVGGLATNIFGAFASKPLEPGRRNQYNAGLQQSFGRFLLVDADYFWKYTANAFDFDTLFNTPIAFPISWRKSKIDGVSVRFSTPNLHGLQAYTNIGHTRARYFGPENGGLIFNSPLNTGVFRIDHDQAFQQTTNLRYQRPKNGWWLGFTWRYDSGEVAGSVPDLDAALSLTAAQQAAIGFFCGSQHASLGNPITACASPPYGAALLRIPSAGTADDDHNPPRVAPRHLFDLGIGTDNLLRSDGPRRITAQLMIVNLTNKVALYNFLSTFSGTHFVSPRTYNAEIGFVF